MLTSQLLRVRHARDRIIPCYVDASAPEWLEVGERLLALFRGREGISRGELAQDVAETFSGDPQQIVHQGLAKLLEDRCDFEVVSRHPPDRLRELVFARAARCRAEGSIPFDREAILAEIARSLEMEPAAVDQGLFADLKSEQRLVKFHDISAERLLQRYNVALAQAVLYKAVAVTIEVRNEPPPRYRQLLRAIKFHRLIADCERTAPTCYRIRVDGPLSLFSSTSKYGLQLALFLPFVLQCGDFDLEATLRWGADKKDKLFTLTPRDGLVSHLPEIGQFVPPEAAMFAEMFRKKIADWQLLDETDVLPLGDHFWVPDFRLFHKETGATVYLEILGFWRKASIAKHLHRLRQHAAVPFLLAVSDQLHIDDADLQGLPAGVYWFRQMPLAEEIARLAREQIKQN